MSRAPHFAVSAAASLILVTILVVGGKPPAESAEVPPAPPIADTTLTTGVVLAGAIESAALDDIELELTAEAAERTTTTSSTPTTSSTEDSPTPVTDETTTETSEEEAAGETAESEDTAEAEGSPAATTTTTTQPDEEETAQGHFEGGSESEFVSRINSLRSSNGQSGLSRDGSLSSRARWWAKEMAARGSLAHSNISSLVPPWNSAAENVGVGGSASGVFDLLAGSSGHRSNMLGDYTHVGVGAWRDAEGALWTVHVFAR